MKIIEEVILSTSKKNVIVVADNSDKLEIYDDITARLNIPRNVKIIVKSLDITDYKMLEYLSLESSKAIIINSFEDEKAIKTVIAASYIIDKYKKKKY